MVLAFIYFPRSKMKMIVLSVILLGMLRMCATQKSDEPVEDKGDYYNYDFEASPETEEASEPSYDIIVTTKAQEESNVNVTETTTTMETTTDYVDDLENATMLPPESQQNRSAYYWESWTSAQLERHMFLEWMATSLSHNSDYDYRMTCYLLSHTFRSAIRDMKRYYKIRTLYEKTLEYEIGYVTQEIVSRYSHVLDMYHHVQTIFGDRPTTKYAPTKYVFIMYSNVLDECKHIIHLCHMLNVIEKKYAAKPMKNAFKDPEKKNITDKAAIEKRKNEKQERIEEKRRERLEELLKNKKIQKKKRKNYLKLWQESTTTRAKSKKHAWPLLYGWSIEDW